MSVKKQNIQNYFLYETHVENLFISEYMPSAPENAVKVYLLGAMHAEQNLPLDDASIARTLSLSAEEVADAWDYWHSCGIVRRTAVSAQRPGEFDTEFLNIKESAFGRRSESMQPEAAPFDLDDEAFSRLLRDVEVATARTLESREPEEIASWISEYGMDPDLIRVAYKYCTERARSNRCRYVGAVLKEWMAKGLTTAEAAQDSIDRDDKHHVFYRSVMKELGFTRNPSEPEKRIMDRWVDELGLSLNEVKDAISKTTGISNPSINYVNTVLLGRYQEQHPGSAPVTAENLTSRLNQLYAQIRESNEAKTAQRREEIFAKLPRIRDILKLQKDCSIGISTSMFKGASGAAEVDRLKKKIADLNTEKGKLLESAGYTKDALDPIYDCKACKDTGVLDDGRRCSCYNEKAERLLRNNG